MNAGAKNLAEKLDRLGHGARKALATELGVGNYTVSNWLAGRGAPNTKQRVRIEELHGTPILAWDEELPDEHGNPSAHKSGEYGAVDPEQATGTESEG